MGRLWASAPFLFLLFINILCTLYVIIRRAPVDDGYSTSTVWKGHEASSPKPRGEQHFYYPAYSLMATCFFLLLLSPFCFLFIFYSRAVGSTLFSPYMPNGHVCIKRWYSLHSGKDKISVHGNLPATHRVSRNNSHRISIWLWCHRKHIGHNTTQSLQ